VAATLSCSWVMALSSPSRIPCILAFSPPPGLVALQDWC
jgi:hypothetical protein